jgi:3-methyladenine DNA glycosylase AlkD
MGLVRQFHREHDEKTFARFESCVDRYITNWAHCDDLCIHLIAPLIRKESKLVRRLRNWPKSKNRWKKRAAIVSFVPLAKHGLFEKEILQISEQLLADGFDDLVNKANGWTLREFGKYSQPKMLAFLKKHREKIPRVTMRYALERTPAKNKKGL